MLGPKPPEIKLMDEERQAPEKLVRRHNMPQQIALRGRIVLAAADGKNNAQIAREFGVNVETPRLWRNRWLTLSPISLDDLSVKERLADLPRPGAPPQITADQRCWIEAMACETPKDSGWPISHWTAREIAERDPQWCIYRVWSINSSPSFQNLGNIVKHPGEEWELGVSTWSVSHKASVGQ